MKISQEINLGLDVGLEVGLGSPTQLSERSRWRVFYNGPFYFLLGATVEYYGLHYCYVCSLGRFTATAGTRPGCFFLWECDEALSRLFSERFVNAVTGSRFCKRDPQLQMQHWCCLPTTAGVVPIPMSLDSILKRVL